MLAEAERIELSRVALDSLAGSCRRQPSACASNWPPRNRTSPFRLTVERAAADTTGQWATKGSNLLPWHRVYSPADAPLRRMRRPSRAGAGVPRWGVEPQCPKATGSEPVRFTVCVPRQESSAPYVLKRKVEESNPGLSRPRHRFRGGLPATQRHLPRCSWWLSGGGSDYGSRTGNDKPQRAVAFRLDRDEYRSGVIALRRVPSRALMDKLALKIILAAVLVLAGCLWLIAGFTFARLLV